MMADQYLERVERLSPQKQSLLALRLAQRGNSLDLATHAANGSPDGSQVGREHQQLVAYVVPKPGQIPTADALRGYLKAKLPAYMVPSQILFLDALPRTPNGKLDRGALPVAVHRLPIVQETVAAPQNEVEQILAQIWADVLGFDQISVHDNFFEVGGDSILSIQIIARANQAGLRLTPNQIFDHPTIAELATTVSRVVPAKTEQGLVTGRVPLTPIQHWFFEQNLKDPHYWNQSMLLQLPADLDAKLLEEAIQQLMLHHDILRARYHHTDTGWEQVVGGAEVTMPLLRVDLAHVSDVDLSQIVAAEAEKIQASFSLSKGPLLRCALFQLGAGRASRLLLVAHHLVIDAVSWRILLEDLESLYRQLQEGRPVEVRPKTTSLQAYAERLSTYATSASIQNDLSYWLAVPMADAAPLPVDIAVELDATGNDMASERVITRRLSQAETESLLRDVPAVYNTRMTDLLLAALAQTLSEWSEKESFLIGLEGHGREAFAEDLDLSQTVGWFTNFFPVLLRLKRGTPPSEALKSIKEQLRQVPNRGMSYGLLRYLSPNPEIRQQLAARSQPQVLFNYLGQWDAVTAQSDLFEFALELAGPDRNLKNQRLFAIEINALIIEGQLQVKWSYSSHLHNDNTITALTERYQEALQSLIAHCLSVEGSRYTPSDFPLARLSQAELDRLIARTPSHHTSDNTIADIYPLSPMQDLMLLHTISTPYADTLLTQIRYSLQGELDVDAFQAAWQKIVKRHNALRTAFFWKESHTPVQVVYRHSQMPFVYQDLRGLSEISRWARLEAIQRKDSEQGFDLSTPPLMRVTLIRLDEDRYELIWTSHHLILDRWCIDIIQRELAQFYAAYRQGLEPAVMPAPSFRNYIDWTQQQDQAAAERFWRKRLANLAGPTPLVVDTPLDPYPVAPPMYEEQQIQIPATMMEALRTFAHNHHLTLNTVVQGAWAVLLSSYSQESEVTFGVAVSGRPPELVGVEATIGSFVNNLPVRVSTSSTSVAGWLKALQEQQLAMQQYGYPSLARIQEWSGVPQRMPLFESLLVYQSATRPGLDLAEGVQMQSLPSQVRTNYPLTLVAMDTGAELSLWFIYDGRRFTSAAIIRMMGHLKTIVEGIAADPTCTVSDLSCLSEEEQQQWALRRRSRLQGAPRNGHLPASPAGSRDKAVVAHRDVLEHQLIKIWEQVLGIEPIGIQDNFFALGGHSLLAIRLFSHIETTFGRKLPPTLLSQAATVEQLAEVMRREEAESDSAASLRPLVAIQRGGSGRPLFYISPPGENMLSFAYFVHHLGADRPCYGLQPLGLNGKEAPYTRAEDMAAHFIREMQRIQPEGPYLLTGTCFGGMVAVEMARQLQAQGQAVAFLALFDTPFPNPTLVSKIKWHLLSLGQLDPKERVNYLLERLKRRAARVIGQFYIKRKRAMPTHLHELYARAGVAQAVNTYIPQQYQGKITLFCAEAGMVSKDADHLRWRSVATGGVDVHLVPGEHSTLMSEPHVHVLVRKFQDCLAQIRADEGWHAVHGSTVEGAL